MICWAMIAYLKAVGRDNQGTIQHTLDILEKHRELLRNAG
jgi:hypothetical protein